MNTKPSNPKDIAAILKVPMSTVSATVLAELGCALYEGARKYGRHNYRVIGVLASVYYDAALRHLMKWWEGENIDVDSGIHHVTKAIASLVVLRDAMIQSKFVDDRPPKAPADFIRQLDERIKEIANRYPTSSEPMTQVGWGVVHETERSEYSTGGAGLY
jgi:Domain of unknown function (DUF5664)